MTLLTIDKVSKVFGKHHALHDVSLNVEPGQFVSLLGPSGCGKTTLLRLIAGFLSPDSGAIHIDGEAITRLPPHRRPLNTVFQNYALFPHMSVLDNVAYGPRRNGATRMEAGDRAKAALALVGLENLGDRFPRQMSGGQQQRVALARAIVNRPKLLLLDEPLSALDLKLRKRMQVELKQIQEKIGVAFIFVTHDQEEAMSMSDVVAVMNAGRIEQLGNGDEIYRKPQTRFVAEFIGDANILPFDDASQQIRMDEEANTGRGPFAVVRPEHVSLNAGTTAGKGKRLALHGTVEAVTSIGGTTDIHVTAGPHRIIVRRLGLAREGFQPGAPVAVTIQREHIHLIGEA